MLATVQGNYEAQANLKAMYDGGQSILAVSIVHRWFNISAANGNEPGAKNRKTVAKK